MWFLIYTDTAGGTSGGCSIACSGHFCPCPDCNQIGDLASRGSLDVDCEILERVSVIINKGE